MIRPRTHLLAATLVALAPVTSGCFSITATTARALHVGAPTRMDPAQPERAIVEIVGVSVEHGSVEPVYHLRVRLEDGAFVHLVGAHVVHPDHAESPGPNVVSFSPEDSPFPATDEPLAVTDWSVRWSDGARSTRPARFLCVGDLVHRVHRNGEIDPVATPLTEGMAAKWGLVEIHLDRDPSVRRQTWRIVHFAPPPCGRSFSSYELTDGDGGTTTVDRRVVLSMPTAVSDSKLFGPRPPAGSPLGTLAFLLACPLTIATDSALWISGIGCLVEVPLGLEEGDLVASPGS